MLRLDETQLCTEIRDEKCNRDKQRKLVTSHARTISQEMSRTVVAAERMFVTTGQTHVHGNLVQRLVLFFHVFPTRVPGRGR
jgi:hypothetical protein